MAPLIAGIPAIFDSQAATAGSRSHAAAESRYGGDSNAAPSAVGAMGSGGVRVPSVLVALVAPESIFELVLEDDDPAVRCQ